MPVVTPSPSGGAYRPLSDTNRDRIVEHAFEMLEHVGMADAPDRYAEVLIAAGGRRRNDGRVLLPRPMVEAALDRAPSTVELPGFVDDHGVSIGGKGVHIGTGGAAVQMLDAATGTTEGFTIDGYGADLPAVRHAHGIYDPHHERPRH